jgi:hypothetical protein
LLKGGAYEHQFLVIDGKRTGGDPDSFRFFLERFHHALRVRGRGGAIVPAALQAALSSAGLRRMLLEESQLHCLVRLDNERKLFPGVHHSQKFDVLAFQRGGTTEKFGAAFLNWESADVLLDVESHPSYLTVPVSLLREIDPHTVPIVELRSHAEARLCGRLYRTFPRLGDKREDGWNVSFRAELHMASDSHLFRDRAWLRAHGCAQRRGEYWTSPERDWYEAQPERFVPGVRYVWREGSRARIGLAPPPAKGNKPPA